jgi:hypothetical protein
MIEWWRAGIGMAGGGTKSETVREGTGSQALAAHRLETHGTVFVIGPGVAA